MNHRSHQLFTRRLFGGHYQYADFFFFKNQSQIYLFLNARFCIISRNILSKVTIQQLTQNRLTQSFTGIHTISHKIWNSQIVLFLWRQFFFKGPYLTAPFFFLTWMYAYRSHHLLYLERWAFQRKIGSQWGGSHQKRGELLWLLFRRLSNSELAAPGQMDPFQSRT